MGAGSNSDDRPQGARALARERLRSTVAETAQRLFQEIGFDRVTTAEVAAACGISQRTLFRHFATKEDFVFSWLDGYIGLICDRIRKRPGGEPPIEVLRRALDPLCHLPPEDARRARAVESLTAKSLALQAGLLRRFASWEARMAEALRGRADVDPVDAAFLAGFTVKILAVAFGRLEPPATDLEELIDHGFGLLHGLTRPMPR